MGGCVSAVGHLKFCPSRRQPAHGHAVAWRCQPVCANLRVSWWCLCWSLLSLFSCRMNHTNKNTIRICLIKTKPESLAMCLEIHQKGEPVSDDWFRRRDADGCGRDDRAPKKSLMIRVAWRRFMEGFA